MKIDPERIRRLHYGYIVAPEGTHDVGQPIPVCGFALPRMVVHRRLGRPKRSPAPPCVVRDA